MNNKTDIMIHANTLYDYAMSKPMRGYTQKKLSVIKDYLSQEQKKKLKEKGYNF